ncbi:uncharacterized DUF1240 family protein [Trabulsiella guamensis ATCC 49490]|uniref:Uncharacterized DUF1240 family protein n=2 Tax=Trabulsiella guamensis TaxID=158852 RepID=A0A085A3G0_9ENTR|nr:uncharacterized DUF1240 family protein [Trabulsiella guamensis ATCC 49490]
MRKLHAFAALLIQIAVLYLLLFGFIMRDFISLWKMGNVISYSKTCIMISSIPLFLYCLFFTCLFLFQKNFPQRGHKFMNNNYVLLITLSSIPIGFIGNIIVPFILMANSYTNCPQENLSKYYVKDVAMCEKIKRSDLF